MCIHSYVGILDSAQPGYVQLRYVHIDGYPQLITRVSMTLAAVGGGEVLPPEPVTVVVLVATDDLDAQRIFLMDPGTDTLTVHTSGGDVVGASPVAS